MLKQLSLILIIGDSSMPYDIDILLKFYNKKISARRFMKYLNSNVELQKEFNKVLRYIPSNPQKETAIKWINDCYKGFTNFQSLTERKSRKYLVWLYVRDYLAKKNYIEFLKREDVEDIILLDVLSMPAFYSADAKVENYVKFKIIANMPQFNSISKAAAYVKEQIKTHFTCDDKMPRWIQCCEWPFDENGEPLVFKKSLGNSSYKKYIFYDKSNREIIIEQFD